MVYVYDIAEFCRYQTIRESFCEVVPLQIILLSERGVINLIDNCIRHDLCHELSDKLNNLGIDDLMSNARPVWIQIMRIGFRETVAVVFYRIVDNPNQKQIHHDQCFEMIGYRNRWILASWANTCSCIMKVPREE